MANNEDTGNGATLTLSTGTTGNFEQISPGEQTATPIEDSHLGTTGNSTFRAADLYDEGEVSGTYQWSSDEAPPTPNSTVTATVTWPTPSGLSTPANKAGTAIITRVKHPELVNNELQKAEITLKWDGKTGPTYTAATA